MARRTFVSAVLSMAGIVAARPALGQSITAVRSSIKIRPNDNPPPQTAITLHAAGDEFEAFQVVIFGGPAPGLSDVTVTLPTLTQGSTSIPASEVRLYHEGTLTFTNRSSPEGATGQWRDPLIPAQEDGLAVQNSNGAWSVVTSVGEQRNEFPISVGGNTNEVVWIDIHVPPNQTPGTYQGDLKVFSGTTPIGTIAVTLVVRSFSLDPTSHLMTTFAVSTDQICLAHGDADANNHCPTVADVHLWDRLYGHFLLDHRITMNLSDNATSGTFVADYGGLIDGSDFPTARRLPGAQATGVIFPWTAPGDTQSTFSANLTSWIQLLNANGWFSKSFHYAKFLSSGVVKDEPGSTCSNWTGPGFIVDQGNWAHLVDGTFPVLVTGNVTDYTNCTSGSPAVNILCPVVDFVDVKANSLAATSPPSLTPGNHTPDYDNFLRANPINHLWMYQTCDSNACGNNDDTVMVNYPSLVVDATAVQNRAEPWMHFIYGATAGMLYFDVASQLSTAWNNPDGIWSAVNGSNGDGTLVYPGTPAVVGGGSSHALGGSTHIPVASIRLKMLREGLEDFEYLRLCSLVNPTTAMNIATSVFPMTGTGSNGKPFGSMYGTSAFPNATPSPTDFANALENAREQLAACIAPSCSPSSCANGCCDTAGNCVTTELTDACGVNGAACANCGTFFGVCSAGVCGSTCNPPNTICWPLPEREAGPSCVNESSDVNNCGGCGIVCGSRQTCSGGQCVCANVTTCRRGFIWDDATCTCVNASF